MVTRIDDLSGSGWISFGAGGSGQGQFLKPKDLAVDSQDRIYIADSGNARIVRIDDLSGEGWTTYP